MNWLYYLLEVNLYIVLFYGFYRLFLQNETFYSLNRYFLLLTLAASFLMPLLQLGFLKSPVDAGGLKDVFDPNLPPPVLLSSKADNSISSFLADVDWPRVIYMAVVLALSIRLSINIIKILNMRRGTKRHEGDSFTLIETDGEVTAFSFFNLLFVHRTLINKPAVLKHELAHIKGGHSFDVLLLEIVHIICWFNPLIYFIKKDLKLLHEYIADDLTTMADVQKHEYALFLIQNSFGLTERPLRNQFFNQSILKRRINMLNKKRTTGGARLRLLLVFPLTAVMLCFSTLGFSKSYGYIDLLPAQAVQQATQNPKKQSPPPPVEPPPPRKNDQVKFPPPVVKPDRKYFYSKLRKAENNTIVVSEDRYIELNGKEITDKSDFYGVEYASTINILSAKQATERFGAEKGKNGAVIISGDKVKTLNQVELPPPPVEPPPPRKNDQVKFPPPVVKKDIVVQTRAKKVPPAVEPPPPRKGNQVKFPPPIVKPDKKYFFSKLRKTDDNVMVVNEDRYIELNGKEITDMSNFYGVSDATTINVLSAQQASQRFGAEKGKNGAVIISGDKVKILDELVVPPPPVEPPPPRKNDQVKFPPPVIKKKTATKFAPPVIKDDVTRRKNQ